MTNDSHPVGLSDGLPETVIAAPEPDAAAALEQALDQPDADRRAHVADVVARWPRFLDAWAEMGDLGRDVIERYACYRVGYHRGLDTLRASGWRGSGYVRWDQPTNRGFLRALAGLGSTAAEIGEHDEAQRCATFLAQLDPSGPWDASSAPS
ncbi:MAG: DUF3151 family protein [Acidimicrobiia bacterium]|nr:DUF3151 family protein [Acidimicrobiia bacterium]MBA3982647.1 DUF3151 family protein [Acidimicrobiia bacterium]MDQ3390153.1 DUF3151 domain-containing protein [Actinomycetota bacterium]